MKIILFCFSFCQIDRTDLGKNWCVLPETAAEFQLVHGIPYSRSACRMLAFTDSLGDRCTSLPYYGIRPANLSTPLCLPKDILFNMEFGSAGDEPNAAADQGRQIVEMTSDPCRY